jgi:MerR family transcriptional regulator, light-induced transcriptional regulator
MPRPGSPRHESGEGLLSIGALSTATGIPVDTIRTWERRYGFPVPERKPSGHRLYGLDLVPRLRRVAEALRRGHRAAEVLRSSETALDFLLASLPPGPNEPPVIGPTPIAGRAVIGEQEDLLDAVRGFDAQRLRRWLQTDWARLGPLSFLDQGAAVFLREVGDAWADGRLEVRHEHFASAVLGDFLRSVRSPLDDRAQGPVAVLATLPGELHGLGLQMAALVFALVGWRALVLGVDTPIPQITALAREIPLAVVALSSVQPLGKKGSALVSTVRQRLPRKVPLLLGGNGARAQPRFRGVEIFSTLSELDRWLRARTTR